MNKLESCPKCQSKKIYKNGKPRGNQRWKCKECKYNFSQDKLKGKSDTVKSLAVLLYSSGKQSYGMIARLLNVSRVAVYKWIRKAAIQLPEPGVSPEVKHIEIDEMWHFVGSKKTKNGSLKHWTAYRIKLSDGWLDLALRRHFVSSSIK